MIAARGGARRLAGALAVSMLAVVAACKRPAPPSEATAAPTAPLPAPSAAPADHLAPGELVEGTQRAFGVVLPQVVHTRESFVDVIYASGPTSVAALVPYFRAHLRGGDLHATQFLATFDHVHAAPAAAQASNGTPQSGRPVQDPGERELRVRIATAPDGASVDIRDMTPPVIPARADDAARWRAAGLTPQGKVVDPTHLD